MIHYELAAALARERHADLLREAEIYRRQQADRHRGYKPQPVARLHPVRVRVINAIIARLREAYQTFTKSVANPTVGNLPDAGAADTDHRWADLGQDHVCADKAETGRGSADADRFGSVELSARAAAHTANSWVTPESETRANEATMSVPC